MKRNAYEAHEHRLFPGIWTVAGEDGFASYRAGSKEEAVRKYEAGEREDAEDEHDREDLPDDADA